jgi:hypothetical protein
MPDFADPFGNLTAKDFAPVLGHPHHMEVMVGVDLTLDRKDGMGAMAIITHGP